MRKPPDIADIATFSVRELKQFIERVVEHSNHKNTGWHAPLALLVTLVLSMLTSEFEALWGIQPTSLESFAYIAIGASALWLFFTFRQVSAGKSLQSSLEELDEISISRKERRVLFILRAEDNKETRRFLVFKDEIWKCYFFPHMHIEDMNNINDEMVRDYISQNLELKRDDVSVSSIENATLQSMKFSETEKIDTFYSFQFYYVTVAEPSQDKLVKLNFTRLTKNYCWLTPEELMSDDTTRLKNGDVFAHVQRHPSYFLLGATDNSIQSSLQP